MDTRSPLNPFTNSGERRPRTGYRLDWKYVTFLNYLLGLEAQDLSRESSWWRPWPDQLGGHKSYSADWTPVRRGNGEGLPADILRLLPPQVPPLRPATLKKYQAPSTRVAARSMLDRLVKAYQLAGIEQLCWFHLVDDDRINCRNTRPAGVRRVPVASCGDEEAVA